MVERHLDVVVVGGSIPLVPIITVNMPVITLNNQGKNFSEPVSIIHCLESLAPELMKNALAAKVNGALVDLDQMIDHDCVIKIVTEQDPEGLDIIRHSAAHILAQAVKQLFPDAQVAIGPVIEDGFYYDFSIERAFTQEDLQRIEQVMREIIQADLPIQRFVLDRDQAIALFKRLGESYKVKIIERIPEHETLSLYQQGDFIDLCRGPHLRNTRQLSAFKLTRVAGAYWQGDARNEMLQRIYGTAWRNQAELEQYLERLRVAQERDHRKLGKQLHLLHLQEEAPGMVFWLPDGWTLYQQIEQYIRERLAQCGYREVRTPLILARSLWEQSGHWDKFYKEMFITHSEHQAFAIKPMNCPAHVQIFNHELRSYRDLPLRLAEFGCCHRNEPSGALHGLMRVRQFTQDDAHIFCAESDIQSEVKSFIDLLYTVYADFGFEPTLLKLATRPEQRVGSDESWDKAEAALSCALNAKGLDWVYAKGEGAFYGPKIEFSLRDCLGRVWQCGTIQVDFSMPERLGATYVSEDGSKKTAVILHRAILGSLERFIGILIEHYGGSFPVWLAPVQAVILTITEKQNQYAQSIYQELSRLGVRARLDLRNEKIGFKIRAHSLHKTPFQLIIGEQEVMQRMVSVRKRGGKSLGNMSLESFYELVQVALTQRGRVCMEEA